jgi:dihydroorotate dehydrogenase (NAD+) catalytic subunit
MIELAPRHKVGLPLPDPLMTAAGCFGYGPEYADWADISGLGAVVTNPVSLRPRRGAAQPRLVETPGGFILNTGGQNPGVRRVLQRYAAAWKRLGRPIVVHLAPDDPEALARTARALETAGAVAGLEVGLPEDTSPADAASLVTAARESELPLLARLPLARAADLAAVCVEAGADALVIGAPPLGSAGSGQVVTGYLYGPAMHALAVHALLRVRPLVDVPLVGCGGIHSVEDARALLGAGAIAVQVDSAIFVDPSLLGRLAEALS